MIIDEDVYLEHFGVKGMRWGVRNQKRGGTKEQRRAGNKKFVRNLAIGVGVGAVGGVAVAAIINRNRNLKIRQINQSRASIQRSMKMFQASQARYASTPMSSINKKTKLSPEQTLRVKRILYNSAQRQNRGAINIVDYRRSLGLADAPKYS